MRALKLDWLESQIKKASVTTQAHEGIETRRSQSGVFPCRVTTQAHEGIETLLPLLHSKFLLGNNSSPHPVPVPGKKV